jgi:hypothetical protein
MSFGTDKGKSAMRKAILWTLSAIVVVFAFLLIAEGVQKQRQGQAVSATTPPVVEQTPQPEPTVSPPEDVETPDERQPTDSTDEIVRAANDTFNSMSVAQFLPNAELRLSVNEMAVPEVRQKLISGYKRTGPFMAEVWGWNRISEVLPFYTTQTEQYRIEKATDSKAVVSLFTIHGWRERINVVNEETGASAVVVVQRYGPGIDIVKLRKVDGKWLFVSAKEPDPGEEPAFSQDETDLEYDEVVARNEPYLEKGFKPYVFNRP